MDEVPDRQAEIGEDVDYEQRNENHEVFVVIDANAVIDPGTVVIESFNTLIASSTVP